MMIALTEKAAEVEKIIIPLPRNKKQKIQQSRRSRRRRILTEDIT